MRKRKEREEAERAARLPRRSSEERDITGNSSRNPPLKKRSLSVCARSINVSPKRSVFSRLEMRRKSPSPEKVNVKEELLDIIHSRKKKDSNTNGMDYGSDDEDLISLHPVTADDLLLYVYLYTFISFYM